jgi:hypothetical protein
MWGGSGTLGGELIFLVLLLFATTALAVVGYVVLVVPVRENPRLCARRRFSHALGCVGFLVGGIYWLLTWTVHDRHFLSGPWGGLLFGAVLGELVGAFVARYLRVEEEGL